MKAAAILLFTSIAAVIASPTPAVGETTVVERNPLEELVARAECKHPGPCGWLNSGQCEYQCDGYGGFKYMQGCGWGRKRCYAAEESMLTKHPAPLQYSAEKIEHSKPIQDARDF
ncbi:hypothetical protein VTK56DRAFT_3194 [Thermocarpiscus australiensis]